LEALVNTDEPWPDLDQAEQRVQRMQTKLHQWAADDPGRRFADLFNLICHPDFLTVAWGRVRANKGARTAGVDRVIPAFISGEATIEAFLGKAREQLRSRTFVPLPVRERLIPKPGKRGQWRRLGIPAAMDRLVQASLVLVLEPIFEADFKPVSYGFRPRRRGQDAIAEIHYLGTKGYHWVFEADITACFDEISHSALLQRVRRRVGDKRVLALIKAFLKAGIMAQDGHLKDAITGTPPRRHRLTAAGQHRTWSARRALLCEVGRPSRQQRTGAAPQTRRSHLPDRPLRGRIRGHGARLQGARGWALGGGHRRARPVGAAPVGGQVPGLPPG
jgi:RNA-directed DNA polymerase